MLGERLEPLLPKLAELQRDGAVSAEQVQIVERAMHTLSRSGADPAAIQTAERLLSDYAPLLGPTDLRRYALRVVAAADPDGPEPIDDQLQQDRRYLELKQRRDGMWWLQGQLTATTGTQLHTTPTQHPNPTPMGTTPTASNATKGSHRRMNDRSNRLSGTAGHPMT